MQTVPSYLVEDEKNLEIIENLLRYNRIEYEVKIEHIKSSMKDGIHQNRRNLYIIFIDEMQLDFADKLISVQSNLHVEYYTYKIVECKEEISKNSKKNFVISILISVGVLLFMLLPVGLLNNIIIARILQLVKGVLIIWVIFYSAKTSAWAVLELIVTETFCIFIFLNSYIKDNALEIVDTSNYFTRYYLFYSIILMIVTVMCGAFYGLRNYKNDMLKSKFSYCAMLVISYLAIMLTTIVGYANLYACYHNELYFKFEDKLSCVGYSVDAVDRESLLFIKNTEEKSENGYLKIEGYYHKERGSKDIEPQPFRINISEYNDSDEFLRYYVVEPENNLILPSYVFGSTTAYEQIYFSVITYFTIGYGDVYPTADTIKTWVIQEALIAHILTVLIVPTLIIIGQTFVSDE